VSGGRDLVGWAVLAAFVIGWGIVLLVRVRHRRRPRTSARAQITLPRQPPRPGDAAEHDLTALRHHRGDLPIATEAAVPPARCPTCSPRAGHTSAHRLPDRRRPGRPDAATASWERHRPPWWRSPPPSRRSALPSSANRGCQPGERRSRPGRLRPAHTRPRRDRPPRRRRRPHLPQLRPALALLRTRHRNWRAGPRPTRPCRSSNPFRCRRRRDHADRSRS
jgi:hypothetical protein